MSLPADLTVDFTPRFTPSFKKYRRHNCTKAHRSPRTMARCVWRRAIWIHGNGHFACVAYCGRGTSVLLCPTIEAARGAKAAIDNAGCGGFCSARGHEIVQLILPDAR